MAGEEPDADTGEPWEGVTIRLTAAQTPVYFYHSMGLYDVADTLYTMRLAVCVVAGYFLLGVALVVWSLLWRRWMALTFRAAGRLTGKIWLEIKLLLLALLVGPLMVSLSYIADPILGLCHRPVLGSGVLPQRLPLQPGPPVPGELLRLAGGKAAGRWVGPAPPAPGHAGRSGPPDGRGDFGPGGRGL